MRKECRISNLWAETGESKLNGSNLVHETTNKIAVIQERLESAKLLKELPWGSDSVPNYDILDYMNFLKIIREVFGSLLLDTIGTSITVIGLITVSLFDSERDRLIIVNGFLCLSVNRLNALMIVVDREHVPFPMFVMIDIEPSQMRIDFDCMLAGNPLLELQEKGVINSGCSRHMTGNKSYLSDYDEIDGGFVAFGGDPKGGRITGKGKISTGKLDFEDVYFVKELKFNLFSVSQMCDKKNNVLFTDTECVVLSPDFKLLDENHVLLRVPRKDNMYSVDLKNIVPSGGLTCLFAKATLDESNLWHRRLGHINFKTLNKLVKGNLVRGLPSKLFEINQTCVACQKGKQHRASCKTKTVSSISQPLQMLHMDLFGPTFVKSLMKKMYCLVVTDDFSRFSWVFFLATKDETSEILKTFITGIENLIDLRVKVIRCDNGTEFKNRVMNQFCEMKGRKPPLSFMRPFGCPVTILNTIEYLGSGPNWLFGIDALTNSMNYKPMLQGISLIGCRQKACDNVGKARIEIVPGKDYILLPMWLADPLFPHNSKESPDAGFNPSGKEEKKDDEDPGNESGNQTEGKNSEVPKVNVVDPKTSIKLLGDPNMSELEDIVYSDDDEDVGAEADINNLDAFMPISPIPTTKIHKDHPVEQIIGDLHSTPQTRRMTKNLEESVCMFFITSRAQEGNPSIKRSKMDRSYARRASAIQVTTGTRIDWLLTFFLGLQVTRTDDGIFISQDKYVDEEVWFFNCEDSKPDIMFVVCAYARVQVTPKLSHLHVVKRIFRYLKGQPKLGLWYPKDSPFDLEAYTDSDYAGASLDRKSTTGGCQFLRSRLISWQCKKQTVVANSTTEAEYVAAC
ncbi:putative ribonuclease H-like domain-containing protein [Tanacetum coccineum]